MQSTDDSQQSHFPRVWLTAGLLLWMFLACCFPLTDTDLFWHLKTGEWILEHGAIPGYDLYTVSDLNNRWIDLHWGFQVVAAVLYRIGGANLLILVKAGILTLALGIGCYAGGFGLRDWQRTLCWFLPAITISGRGYERPEIVTLVCLATWLAIVVRLESRPKWIWALPALQLFWINCHALFILGLVVGACFVVDYFVRLAAANRWGLGSLPQNVSPSMVIRAAGLCAFAALVNPYFEEGALFPFVLFRKFTVDQYVYATIGEFQLPYRFFLIFRFQNIYLDAEILLWLAAAASFVVLAVRGRFSVFRTLLFAGFSYLAWKASRNTNIFSMVAGFVLAENISEFRSRAPSIAAHDSPESRAFGRLDWNIGAFLTVMIALVVSGEWNRRTEGIRPFRLGEGHAVYAHDAARFLGRPGFPDWVYGCNFGMASIYTYHNGPERKVFMDGRLEVCSKETYQRFEMIRRLMQAGHPGWTELLRDKNGTLPAVMLDIRSSRNDIAGALRTPGWRLVYVGQAAVVFLDEKMADSLNLPAISFEPPRQLPEM